jgi:hypothetical protein
VVLYTSSVSKQTKLRIISIGIGVAYGLAIRGLIQIKATPSWSTPLLWVMSIAFVIAVPFSLGYVVVAVRARQRRVGFAERILDPWLVVLLALLGCELVGWEGTVCIVMITPIALVCGSLGGLTAGAAIRPSQPHMATMSMVIVALLPFVVGPAEHRLPPSQEIRSVESDVTIHATPRVIWANIERVRPIDPSELERSWNRSIGFPRPIEATLSYEGVGGVRHATFAGDVVFIETIDEWDPERRLGFSIHPDTKNIPRSTLDEHVTVGGSYFDVLHGEYILEPGSTGETRLRLISRHRVSTDFNWYARLWTDAVMRDVQRSILHVIKNRCENGGGGGTWSRSWRSRLAITADKLPSGK